MAKIPPAESPSPIKNIILDLGGVLYDLDHARSQTAFERLGIAGIYELFSHSGQSLVFDRFETGQIDSDRFRNHIRTLSPLVMTDSAIDRAFNALLLGFRHLDYFSLLLGLRVNFRTFLLSNNNPIHYAHILKELEREFHYPSLAPFFEKAYYSHLIGLRKPDPAVFTLVLRERDLIAGETLFIDDTLVHIQAAKALGIQTYHKRQDENLGEIMAEMVGYHL